MKHISKKNISRIKDKADIVKIISEYVVIKKQGNSYLGLCPFHSEKTPSFTVSPNRQFYHCFGCGEGGDIYNFIMEIEKVDFVGAVNRLAKLCNISLNNTNNREEENSDEAILRINKKSLEYNVHSNRREEILDILNATHGIYREELFNNSSLGATKAREYLEKRGIRKSLVDRFEIGYAPSNDVFRMQLENRFDFSKKKLTELLFRSGLIGKEGFRAFSNRITLPIKNMGGEIIGFNARVTNGRKKMKYKNTGSTELFSKSNLLYGLNLIDRNEVREEGLFLVEGQFDIFGFVYQGKKNCLGMGNSSLTENNIEIIRELDPRKIFLVTDGDLPSVNAAIKNADSIYKNRIINRGGIRVVPTPDGKDPFDFFYSDSVDIGSYVTDYSLGVKDFLLSRNLEDFENQTTSGLSKLENISGNLFSSDEFRDIVETLLSKYILPSHR